MIRHTLLCLALSSFVAGCAATDDGLDDTGSSAEAAGSITINSTGITARPATTLPASRLSVEAYGEGAITARLLRSTEPLATVQSIGGRVVRESTTWHLERDAATSQVLFVRRVAPGAPVARTDAQLQTASLQRLAEWGLPSSEVLRTLQRRSMRQSEEDGVRGAATVHRHKTFVLRGFNGIPVQGHRAVVTHSPDGVIHRALIRWPALAPSGHALRTSLTTQQISLRAIQALAAEGETTGLAVLRWKYVPALNAAGQCVLTLRVGARMAAVAGADTTEEPREIDVDVSATP